MSTVNAKVYSHGGKYGDLIYTLPLILREGGGELVLYPNPHTGMTFTPQNVEVVRPLLEAQSYVHGVRYGDHPEGDNLDRYRHHWSNNLNITDIVFRWRGLDFWDRNTPWLKVEPRKVARVVFSRCPRYRNGDFPWAKVKARYGAEAVFLGLPEEHKDFVGSFGPVPFYPTRNLLEVAEVVAGCELLVGNQSSPRAIAEGLKKPVLQETARDNDNCHWERPKAWYGYRSDVHLPDWGELA